MHGERHGYQPCDATPSLTRLRSHVACPGRVSSMSLTLTDAMGCEPPALHELSAESRAGQRFEPTLERSLDDDLVSLAMRLPGAGEGVAVAREFPGGRGIADVVAVTRWHEGLRRRIATELPFLRSETDCAVVAGLAPNRTRTAKSLGKQLGMSEEQVRRRLRSLVTTGHAEIRGSGFRRAQDLKPIGRSYALEAKVSDWQKGMSQALRYSMWCDAASVVLLRPPRDLSKIRDRCATLSLGLAVEDRWLIRPRLGRPHAGLRLAMSEQWARLMADSESL